MDPSRFSRIAHGSMPWWNPVPARRMREVLDLAVPGAGAVALDLGCGAGALLTELAVRHGAAVVGVDRDPKVLALAAQRLRDAGIPEARVELVCGAVEDLGPPGPFDLVANVGAVPAGGLTAWVPRLRDRVRDGGALLIADGVWRREPDPAYLAELGGDPAMLGTHSQNVDGLRRAGLEVVLAEQLSRDAFARYESTYAANMYGWLEEHPDDPDAHAFRSRIDRWQQLVHGHGLDTLGFAIYLARRPVSA